MNDDNPHIHRLTRWNRFWLASVVLYTLVGGYNYLEHRIISSFSKLYLNWATDESIKGQLALEFSSSQGGPFVVTHLVIGSESSDTARAGIAELPRPLFVRGPKARTYILANQLAKLVWIDSEGKKVAAPKPNSPILALYYETQKVVTTE